MTFKYGEKLLSHLGDFQCVSSYLELLSKSGHHGGDLYYMFEMYYIFWMKSFFLINSHQETFNLVFLLPLGR